MNENGAVSVGPKAYGCKVGFELALLAACEEGTPEMMKGSVVGTDVILLLNGRRDSAVGSCGETRPAAPQRLELGCWGGAQGISWWGREKQN
ncbi:hypothetical protein NDU88_010158 [Pleurodeles waltl]|uniref:Uncharacterized protein n=1 Tax=Pleurodeles waltl TaxID=8319 RepID=A0AAV7PU48_PLEWA|nr:hypothetical protein NDU88_010158 [Pleurodeles waltl]